MFRLLFKKGKIHQLNDDERELAVGEFQWLHIGAAVEEVKPLLKAEQLETHSIEVLCEPYTRPRLFIDNQGQCMATIRLISQQDNVLELSSLRIMLVGNKLISVSLVDSSLVDVIRQSLNQKKQAIATAEQLFWYLFQAASDGVSSVVIDLDDGLSALEDGWEDSRDIDVNKLHQLRRDASRIKRFLLPQHDLAIKALSEIDQIYGGGEQLNLYERKWQNTTNGIKRDLESLTASIERLAILQESLDHHKQEATNQTMYVLSIVATFFLPLTFVASLLGMNVLAIPFGDNAQGFWWVCAILLVITVLQIILFKKWKWIK